jgi:HEAT repeat protein
MAFLKSNMFHQMTTPVRPICTALMMVLCMTGPLPAAGSDETAALAVLTSDAGVHEKARACQQLAVVGGPKAVPALAALLGDEHLAAYARSGLEIIADPAAGQALRSALPKLSGRLLAGAVNSLGVRRDIAAVPDLQKLALDSQRGVAAEALASLGMIATAEAAKSIREVLVSGPEKLRVPAAQAALAAAKPLAGGGNSAIARELLDSIIATLPPGHLPDTAKGLAASIAAAKPSPVAPK